MTLALLVCMSLTADHLAPGDHRRSLTVDGLERTYFVHIPKRLGNDELFPVVLAFHGGGSDAEQMIAFSDLNSQADRAGFVAVYPNGAGRVEGVRTWNAGNCCGYAQRHQIDDVKFIRQLLDDLANAIRVDVTRIYATGMSNGAMMSYRLAAEMSEKIAAIAPVGGPMGTEDCSPSLPVPICHFHGTDDQFAPFTGGRGARSLSRTNFYSVEHTLQRWITANGCRTEPTVTQLPAQIDDGTTITKTVYAGGKDGVEVVLYTIHGGGHTWPGRQPLLRYLGPSTRNLSANEVMWEFFTRFHR
jgi:polyhydroxybutyrate depolymerase